MRRSRNAVSLVLMLLAPHLTTCGPSEREPTPEPRKGVEQRLLVYASNHPLQYFAERIAGPLAEVKFPAAQSPDPANWTPTVEDILAMQQADLILLNGASYEQWLKSVTLPPSRLVDTTARLQAQLLPMAKSVTHSHGPEGDHEHAGTAFTTWLDLSLAAEQVRSIESALASRWPEHAAVFRARAGELVAELLDLDGKMRELMSDAESVEVVYSHPVYQYFQRRYGMVGPSLHWEPEEAPDLQAWAELEHLVATGKARWMIWETPPQKTTVDRLAERGLSSVVIDPCGSMPSDGDFLSVMRGNLVALREIWADER